MGLGISTHFALKADELARVNKLLKKQKLPLHEEPATPGAAKTRKNCDSFPYSFIHYLRRAFAMVHEGQELTPVVEGEDPAEEPAIDDVASMLDSHLICHSDCEGYYVPIDFDEVIFDLDKVGIPGGMLGSSMGLMKELVEVAPALQIKLKDGKLDDATAKKLADEEEDSTPYWRERLVWLALFEAARVSIANKTLIVFC